MLLIFGVFSSLSMYIYPEKTDKYTVKKREYAEYTAQGYAHTQSNATEVVVTG